MRDRRTAAAGVTATDFAQSVLARSARTGVEPTGRKISKSVHERRRTSREEAGASDGNLPPATATGGQETTQRRPLRADHWHHCYDDDTRPAVGVAHRSSHRGPHRFGGLSPDHRGVLAHLERGRRSHVEALAADFEAQNPDIDVIPIWVPQGAAQKERLLLTMAAGTPPDLMVASAPVSELALSGLLRPIDDLLERSEHFTSANYAPEILDLYRVDGVAYGVPAIEVGPMLGLAINVDLFHEAGLATDSAVTLDDLRQAHTLLTRTNGDVITQLGFSPFDAVGGMYFPDVWAAAIYDHPVYDSDTKTLRINTPQMQDLLEYLRSFFDDVTLGQVNQFHGTTAGGARGLPAANWRCTSTGTGKPERSGRTWSTTSLSLPGCPTSAAIGRCSSAAGALSSPTAPKTPRPPCGLPST